MWKTMHQISLKATLSYWIPVTVIMLSLVCILVRSFYRYHQKKLHKRLLQYEYLEVNYNVHRPRIGDIHCFSHSSKISDLTMSLSSSDLNGWVRTPRGNLKYSRSISNQGYDRYGNPLAAVPEEQSVYEKGKPEAPSSIAQSRHKYDLQGDEYGRERGKNMLNSYYEEAGLPVPSKYNNKKKTEKKEKKKKYKVGLDSMYRNDHSNENDVSELTNRRSSGIPRSPRRLPDLENSYWQMVDPSIVAQMGSLPIDPEESRSLSHQYEYELIQQQQRHFKKKRKLREKIERIVRETNRQSNYSHTRGNISKEEGGTKDDVTECSSSQDRERSVQDFQKVVQSKMIKSLQESVDDHAERHFESKEEKGIQNCNVRQNENFRDTTSPKKRTFLLDPSDIPQSTV